MSLVGDASRHTVQTLGPPAERVRTAVRWRWIAACELAGAGLIASALEVESAWAWKGVVPATLVNLGTTVGLGGVLFLLERHFTGSVRESTEAVREVEERLVARTTVLEDRLDNLTEATRKRTHQRNAEQDIIVESLSQGASFANVTKSLEEANRLGALATGMATVQASDDPDGIALVFAWGVHQADGRFGEPSGLSFDIRARIEADQASQGPRPIVEITWKPDESATEIGVRLIERLQRVGRWSGDSTLDWGLALHNLQRTIKIAISSRRRDTGVMHLQGALFEMIGEHWALTNAGAECPARGYILLENQFPERVTSFSTLEDREVWPPPAPDWADPAEWSRVLRRGRLLFPRSQGPYLMQPTWTAWLGAPSDEA